MLKFMSGFRLVSESKTTPMSLQFFFKNKSSKSLLLKALIDCTFNATIPSYANENLTWIQTMFLRDGPFDRESSYSIL